MRRGHDAARAAANAAARAGKGAAAAGAARAGIGATAARAAQGARPAHAAAAKAAAAASSQARHFAAQGNGRHDGGDPRQGDGAARNHARLGQKLDDVISEFTSKQSTLPGTVRCLNSVEKEFKAFYTKYKREMTPGELFLVVERTLISEDSSMAQSEFGTIIRQVFDDRILQFRILLSLIAAVDQVEALSGPDDGGDLTT